MERSIHLHRQVVGRKILVLWQVRGKPHLRWYGWSYPGSRVERGPSVVMHNYVHILSTIQPTHMTVCPTGRCERAQGVGTGATRYIEAYKEMKK